MTRRLYRCQVCGKKDETVTRLKNCGFQEEIHPEEQPIPEIICDDCEELHCREI